MAINISEDINVTTGGKLTDIGAIQGGWRTVDNLSDMHALTASAAGQGLIQNGQVFYVSSSRELYTIDITGAFPFTTYNFNGFEYPRTSSSGGGGSGDITDVIAGDGLTGGATSSAATLSIDTSSAHFITGVVDQSVFQQTGSIYATTNDLQITGSLGFNKNSSGNAIEVYSGVLPRFEVSSSGLLTIATQSSTPTAVEGGLYLDTNYDLYVGVQS